MQRKASRSEPLVKQILKATFPEYKGRKITITTENFPKHLVSFWSGGSISLYAFFQPDTGRVYNVDNLEAPWVQYNMGREFFPENMPDSVVLVRHRYFCGHDAGITIYVKQPDQKMLEE